MKLPANAGDVSGQLFLGCDAAPGVGEHSNVGDEAVREAGDQGRAGIGNFFVLITGAGTAFNFLNLLVHLFDLVGDADQFANREAGAIRGEALLMPSRDYFVA